MSLDDFYTLAYGRPTSPYAYQRALADGTRWDERGAVADDNTFAISEDRLDRDPSFYSRVEALHHEFAQYSPSPLIPSRRHRRIASSSMVETVRQR